MRRKIGVIVNYLYEGYQLKVLAGIFDAAKKLNVDILTFVGGNLYSEDIENQQRNKIYNLISKETIDGLILMGLVLGYNVPKDKIIGFYNKYKNQIPLVSLGLYLEDIPSITVDNSAGFKNLLSHLINDHGYKNIAFVTGPQNNEDAQERYYTFFETMKKYNIKPNPDFIFEGDFAKISGIEAVKTFLDERKIKPEVIVFSNDMMAIGGIEELQRRNIKVPEEIAVTGFDNIEESYFINPTLTTVNQPLYELGKRAVETCLSIIKGDTIENKVTLPSKLIIRESCGHKESPLKMYYLDKALIKEKITNLDQIKNYKKEFLKLAKTYVSIEEKNFNKVISDIYDSFFAIFLDKKNLFLEIIERYIKEIDNLEILKELLSLIYSFVETFFPETFLEKTEMIIQKALLIINIYSEKTLRYDKFRTNEETEQLGFIGSDLLSSFRMEEILERISQRIPELNIKNFYIIWTKNDHQTGELILAHVKNKVISKKYKFSTIEIIPKELYPKENSIFIIKPLYFQNNFFGYIVFEYGPKRGIIYEILRAQISAAMQGAILFEEINKLAITDPLTLLPNRRHIENELQKEIARSTRYERPLSVMVIDLDNFKLINDTFGHKYGDEVLKKIGETIRKSCRKVDTVGRYGGDEFVIILPETNLEKGIKVADKIIRNLEKTEFILPNGDKTYVTVSIGIASFPEITKNPEKLLGLADLAMYKAKRLGGKQYSIASY